MRKASVGLWIAIFLTCLGTVAMIAYGDMYGRNFPARALIFCFLPIGLRLALSAAGFEASPPANPRRSRSDQGRWLDAPIAEADKSTFGRLLASRWQRDPSLRVVTSRGGPGETPGPHGGLWDRDLDG